MSKSHSVMAVATIIVGVAAGSAQAETVTGRASVIDGDTIEIRGQRFRLQGVDTPESAQTCQDMMKRDYPCGRQAALALLVAFVAA